MKRLLLLSSLVAGAIAAAGATELTLADETFTVDTLFHAKVGPGTTQTSVRLHGKNSLNVFYLTVDRGAAPDVKFRASCGKKLAGNATVRRMATDGSDEHTSFFAGVNGDFYTTSGTATNGSSKVGTPTYCCIVDGEIFKSSNGNYQFSVDHEGVARINRLNFYQGMASKGDATAEFHGVNVMSPNNSLTLYTPRFWGSANQNEYAGKSAEVTCRLVEGESFTAGTKFKVEVTGMPEDSGDAVIPDDGFVLFGRGTTAGRGTHNAIDFVNALRPGDIVEIDNTILTPDGEKIYPLQVVSGNPKNVGGGVNLDSEGERGDAKDRHPRTGIGVSEDGKTIVMMVIDGRSASSAGVTTGMLGDMLLAVGCHEGVNLDGGGSSTLYTAGLGVRNHCSDGNERAVGNAIFATVDGDVNDTEVAEICFADWRANAPGPGVYSPTVYAFNAAGVMIDNDYKGFTLSCGDELGTISADGRSLYTNSEGKGVLTATAGAATATMPVYITPSEARARQSRVIVDGIHPYVAEVTATVDGTDYALRAEAFDWESSDPSVATIDAAGAVTPFANGETTITGRRGSAEISFAVSVELPAGQIMPFGTEPEWWQLRKSSVATADLAIDTDGYLSVDYTMPATVRAPAITLQANKELWSRPDAIIIEADYATAPSKVELIARTAQTKQLVTCTTTDPEAAGLEWQQSLDALGDLDDHSSYPIFLSAIRITPAEKSGESGRFTFRTLAARYSGASGIESVGADTAAGCGPERWYRIDGTPVNATAATSGLYIRHKDGKATKVIVNDR